MTQTILVILGIVIILLLLRQNTRERVAGICAAAIGLDTKKRQNKERIEALLKEKGSLSNADIREVLRVSERTVVRYMDELEHASKIEQIGSTGRNVTYRLK